MFSSNDYSTVQFKFAKLCDAKLYTLFSLFSPLSLSQTVLYIERERSLRERERESGENTVATPLLSCYTENHSFTWDISPSQ